MTDKCIKLYIETRYSIVAAPLASALLLLLTGSVNRNNVATLADGLVATRYIILHRI